MDFQKINNAGRLAGIPDQQTKQCVAYFVRIAFQGLNAETLNWKQGSICQLVSPGKTKNNQQYQQDWTKRQIATT